MKAVEEPDRTVEEGDVYLVAATGGLECPSYSAFSDLSEATSAYRRQARDLISQPGDRVQLLRIRETLVTVLDESDEDRD